MPALPPKRPMPDALDAAERHLRLVVHGRAVDVADARVDALRATLNARAMSRPNTAARQAVLVVVGAGDRLLDAVHAHDALHRAEGLLVVDAHARRHVVEHGGRHQRAVGLAAAHQLGALGQRVVDQRVAVLAPCSCRSPSPAPPARACADRRAAGLRPWRRTCATKSSAIFWSTMMRSVVMQIWPAVGEGAEGGGVHRVVEVGVVQHHQRRLAAELEHHRLQVLGAGHARSSGRRAWSR